MSDWEDIRWFYISVGFVIGVVATAIGSVLFC